MKDSLRQPVKGSQDDTMSWRLLGVAAAFATGWLAGHVAGQGGLAAEQKIEPIPEQLPTTVRLASLALSSVAYPAVYLPLSLGVAALLTRRGVEHADAVPRSALAAWITYHVVKSLVDRERPPSERGSATDDRSYPSGHAAAAGAIAMATAMVVLRSEHGSTQGGVRPALTVPVLIGAPLLIGASRVALAKHWPTDVIGGWATGIAVATHVTANRQNAPAV
jgi:membrane-associated phospholipid phosphatase